MTEIMDSKKEINVWEVIDLYHSNAISHDQLIEMTCNPNGILVELRFLMEEDGLIAEFPEVPVVGQHLSTDYLKEIHGDDKLSGTFKIIRVEWVLYSRKVGLRAYLEERD